MFAKPMEEMPMLDGVVFIQLSFVDCTCLVAPFSPEEIKEDVWNCVGDKSPGPDGFNFSFF